jgi:hypothetical protein
MNEMPNRYWFKGCPRCNGQGRLFIQRERSSGRLYLHCEECEFGFFDPERSDQTTDGFLAIDVDFELPDLKEIESQEWRRFALHEELT